MLQIRKDIAEYDRAPKGYGTTYIDSESGLSVCYPFPVHLLILTLRWFWIKILNTLFSSAEEQRLSERFEKG
jgi:hypothetical protein